MNIANIFGLHLNCPVKCKKYDEVGVLHSVDEHACKIMYKAGSDTAEYLVDCKLLLKPLSAITEKELIEIVFEYDSEVIKCFMSSDYIWYTTKFSDTEYGAALSLNNPKILLDMASRGFDINVVPNEYKEVLK